MFLSSHFQACTTQSLFAFPPKHKVDLAGPDPNAWLLRHGSGQDLQGDPALGPSAVLIIISTGKPPRCDRAPAVASSQASTACSQYRVTLPPTTITTATTTTDIPHPLPSPTAALQSKLLSRAAVIKRHGSRTIHIANAAATAGVRLSLWLSPLR